MSKFEFEGVFLCQQLKLKIKGESSQSAKIDTPKYLRLLEAELIIEFFVMAVIIIANRRKNRRKSDTEQKAQ